MKNVNKKIADQALETHQEKLFDKFPEIHRISVVQKENSEDYILEAGMDDVQAFEAHPRNSSYPKTLSISVDEPESLSTSNNETNTVEVEFVLVNEAPPKTSELEQEVTTLDQARYRPVAGGDSIGNSRFRSAGTLGSAVTLDGKGGFFLTNYHVLMGNGALHGDTVLQPGKLDGGKPRDKIAVSISSTLNQHVDMAIGRMDNPTLILNSIRRIGSITGVDTNIGVGAQVKKSGRTTNHTRGKVLSVNTTVRVNGSSYPNGSVLFKNQIMTSKMLEGGDSGSILLSSSNKAVGLCFAGSSTRSYANPISFVISAVASGSTYEAESLNFPS